MTSAKALLIVGIVTIPLFASVAPLVAALGVPDAGNPGTPMPVPTPSDVTCAADGAVPRLIWTTCATKTDFSTGNLSVAGHALIGESLTTNVLAARTLDVAGGLRAGSAALGGALSAASGAFSGTIHANEMQIDGRTEVGLLQVHLSSAPSCVEGTLAVVRNPDGSDTLEACLRTGQGGLVWTPIAMGGFVPSMTQPRPS